MTDKELIKYLKNKGLSLKPVVNIGKNGITPASIEQINRVLKKQKLIKVKMNKGSLDEKPRKEIAEDLLQKIDAQLIDFRGFSLVLFYKKIDAKTGLNEKDSDFEAENH